MERRKFVALLGGASLAWPLAARGQQPIATVGYLHSASASYLKQFTAALAVGLSEAGYIEGKNVAIEYRAADGHYERLPALVADLLERRVAVIFAAGGTDPAKAAKAATSTTPIVFISATDPVRTGLVASLNRPGGNVTGVSLLASVLDAKKLGLLRDLAPKAAKVGAVINPNYPGAAIQADGIRAAASQLGMEAIVLSAGTDREIDSVFANLPKQGVGAVVVASDPYFNSRRELFVAAAARGAVPVIYPQREFVSFGGLMSYGPNFADGYRQAGVYIGRILSGEKPAELPVLQPTKFELVLNLKTAKALGLELPSQLLALADDVIE
jgi:putative ABC transport system substrate-binding protein